MVGPFGMAVGGGDSGVNELTCLQTSKAKAGTSTEIPGGWGDPRRIRRQGPKVPTAAAAWELVWLNHSIIHSTHLPDLIYYDETRRIAC